MNHDMRCNSDVECWESYPEFEWSFSQNSLTHSIDNVFVGVLFGLGIQFHFLHSDLHVIKWKRKESSKETSHTFSQNLGLNTIGIITILIMKHFGDLCICAQLTSCQCSRSHDISNRSFPQTCNSLFPSHSCSSINKVLVISSLFFWQESIILKSHHCQICWVRKPSTSSSRKNSVSAFSKETRIFSFFSLITIHQNSK